MAFLISSMSALVRRNRGLRFAHCRSPDLSGGFVARVTAHQAARLWIINPRTNAIAVHNFVKAPDIVGAGFCVFDAPILGIVGATSLYRANMRAPCLEIGVYCLSPVPARHSKGMQRATKAGKIRNAVAYLGRDTVRNSHVPLRRALPEGDVVSKPRKPFAVRHLEFCL